MAYTNIDDPSAYFQTLTYTGNGSHPRNLTNDGNSDLQPDLVWLKKRNQAGTDHVLANSSIGWDAPKGAGYPWENGPFGGQIASNSTGAESTPAATYGYVSAALTDGFTAEAGGSNGDSVNQNSKTFVAWQWKANGGTTASNSDGSVTSTVQANTDAGFSIVTFESASSGIFSVGHGLGVQPAMIITKNREGTSQWYVWHQHLTGGTSNTSYLFSLNRTDGEASYANAWGAGVTSSVFGMQSGNTATASNDYIAYCFAEKQGYSKFGIYTGTGNRDGAPFVYTGFQPAFIMVKKSSASGTGWAMFDNKRVIANGDMHYLASDRGDAESGTGFSHADPVDFVSNGFLVKNSDAWMNTGGASYVYMAFAQHPFVTSTGVPTTAR